MRRLLLLGAMLCLAAVSVAQGTADSVAIDFPRQYNKLYKAYLDDTNDVAAMLELSAFYSQENNPMHSYSLAMKYANEAVVKYRAMVASGSDHRRVTRFIKKGITIEVAQQRREEALLQASKYVVVSKSITEAELDDMSRNCGDSPAMQRLLEKKRIILDCDQAQKENTLTAYKTFIQRYPGTPEAYDCQVLMGKMAARMFEKAGSSREVDSMAQPYKDITTVTRAAQDRKSALVFDTVQARGNVNEVYRYLSKYPYTSQYVEALDVVDAELEKQLDLITEPRQIIDFIHQNETSPLSDMALKKLRHMFVDEHNTLAAQLYFENFPSDPEYMSLYQLFYKWHTTEGNSNPLENFARQNPNFPYQEELQVDLALGKVVDAMDFMQPFSESQYTNYLKYVFSVPGKDIAYVATVRTLQQLIAAKNWDAVVQRMSEFSPSFELYGSDLLVKLYNVINASTDVRKSARSEVSVKYNVLNPHVTADGDYLYYTRQEGGHSSVHVDQYVAGKQYKWINLGNVQFANAEKGNYVFYSLYDNDQRMLVGHNGDIWTAVKESVREWRLDEKLPAPVNTEYKEFDAVMLEDGSGMLLASDRPGGMNMQSSGAYFHGDTAEASDIYYIPRLGEGWGTPINLGLNVNSIYCERSPILSDDMKTLYFITDGRAGMGYGDIYYATREDVNDWTGWTEAKNYGKEVNTGLDEHSISLSVATNRLFFSTNRTGFYSCYTTAAIPSNGLTARRVVVNCGEAVRLQVVDPATHAVLSESKTSGEPVACCLYPSKQYLVVPQDYADFKLYIPAMSVTAHTQGQQPVTLKSYFPTEITNYEGASEPVPVLDVPLPAIHFVGETAILQPEATQELDRLAAFLKHNKGVRADLSLCVKGNDDRKCFDIGRQRSSTILQYLKEKGINTKRFTVANYGNAGINKSAMQTEVMVNLQMQ